jgi:transposase
MGGVITREDWSASELRQLARRERDGRVCVRLLMIAHLLDGMAREDAARAVGLGRQAAYDWPPRYNAVGIDGLRDRPRTGRPRKVDAATGEALKARILAGAERARDGVVAFRGVDVQRLLKEEFGVSQSLAATYQVLHRLALSWLAPRPRHPGSDAAAQEAFRQLSDLNWNASGTSMPRASGLKSGSPTRRVSARRTV